MVIVATIALSTMVSNDLVIPALLRARGHLLGEIADLPRLLLRIRRGTIVVVLLLGYLYFRLIGESYALVTIGLVSFCAAAQFAPAIVLGIFWKGASRLGAIAGLTAGILIWGYMLLLPGFAKSGWLPVQFVDQGPFGLALLHPYELFGLTGLDAISHSLFWSLLANAGLLVGLSLFRTRSVVEQIQANNFVDVFLEGTDRLGAQVWQGTASVSQLQAIVGRFLGPARAETEFAAYAKAHDVGLERDRDADPDVVGFAERVLAGAVGAASARVMVSSVVGREALSLEGVMGMLDESAQVREYSRRLEQKSRELEDATQELRTANERLQELDRLKDEFVSTVSHELRTPLTSIRAFSEILEQNPEMEIAQRQEFLQIVVKETERLTRLINEVLDLAKIESGRMDWKLEALDLRDILRESVAAVGQLLREREVELTQEMPSLPATVLVDRDRVTQVVINLLSNAAKFCEEKQGRVVVRIANDSNGFRVEVRDNGPGIPRDQVDRIFEKFHQVDGEGNGKPRGTGLGLAISQRIVEHHGGRIWVESTGQDGTTFAFVLPSTSEAQDEIASRQ